LEKWLRQGRALLLLDGLNEVQASYQEAIERDIEALLLRYPGARLVLTSRPGVYRNQFRLPTLRLRPLTDDQMVLFLERNSSVPSRGRAFAEVLRRHPRLWTWGRNPLMLWMLLRVGEKAGGQLPANRGQLMRLFIQWILDRESRKGRQTDPGLKVR